MAVVITGNNTPTAGGVTYGDGTTYANTAAGTSGQVLLSNGSSAPTWGTAGTSTTATNLAGGSNGTIPYQSAAGTTQMLAVGSAGQVLQTNGAGAPTWVTPGGGSWVYLSTVTASNSATVDIETTFNSTYDVYAIVVNSLVTVSASSLRVRVKISGSYSSSSIYSYISDRASTFDPNRTNTGATGESFMQLTSSDDLYEAGSASSNFVMYVYKPSSTATYKYFSAHGQGTYTGDNTGLVRINNASAAITTSALTGVRFYFSVGNIASGTFRLYGIRTS
jgi:hypothetical protein